jgi:hypothetical protein
MQTSQVKCLSFDKLNYDVPASVEEFDKLAGRSGAALDEANKNVLYRAVLNRARYGFLHGLEEDKEAGTPAVEGLEALTGIERKTKITKPEVKDAEGKITQEQVEAWDETEANYEERVYATLVAAGKFPSVDAAIANYRSLMQDVLDALPFDPSKQERQSAGPKKTPKTYIGIAEALIERCSGSVEDAVARFNAKTGQSIAATKEALAKGIWDDQVAQKKKIAEGYAS